MREESGGETQCFGTGNAEDQRRRSGRGAVSAFDFKATGWEAARGMVHDGDRCSQRHTQLYRIVSLLFSKTTATALKLAGEYLPAQRRALGSLFATAKAAVLAQARKDSDCISCDAEKHWMEPYQRQLLEKVRGEVTTAAADQGEVGTAEQDRYFHAVRGAIGIEPTDS